MESRGRFRAHAVRFVSALGMIAPVCASGPVMANNGNLVAYDEKWGGAASYTQYSQPAAAGGAIGYDGVNRLTSMSDTGGWSRSWAYDQWGNMAISGNTGAQTLDVNAPQGTDPSQIYNANNQRADAGLGYDAAGNLNAMNGFTGNSIVYDAENRLLGAGRTGAGVFAYSYDGNGRRVSKTSSANTTVYVYDAQGELAAEYNSAGWAAPPCTTCYLSYDHLGSVRMVTDSGGNVISRHDFFPFGEEITNSSLRPAGLGFAGTDEVSQRFTGKERDSESGLDFFGARYYASSTGRWMSSDPSNLGIDIYMPQTWNRYNYILNNPLAIKDNNGLWPFYVHNQIINESFPGMSKKDLQTLKDASWNMDFAPHQQDASNSYQHGLYDDSGDVYWGGGNQAHDAQQADDYISSQIQAARQAQADWEAQGHAGIAPAALTAFGNALHTTTDRTSPSHAGTQGWSDPPWYSPKLWIHIGREAFGRDASQKAASDAAARSLFKQTFGNEFDWGFLQKSLRSD